MTPEQRSRKRGSHKGIAAQRAMRARGEQIKTKPLVYQRPVDAPSGPAKTFRGANEALNDLQALWP